MIFLYLALAILAGIAFEERLIVVREARAKLAAFKRRSRQ